MRQFQITPDEHVIVRGPVGTYVDTAANFIQDYGQHPPPLIGGATSVFYDQDTGALYGSNGVSQMPMDPTFASFGGGAINGVAALLQAQATRLDQPTPPGLPPTNADRAATALADKLGMGINISSTSDPALNGVYATDPASQFQVTGLATTVMFTGAFPGGGTSFPYAMTNGTPALFTSINSFKAFCAAFAFYIVQLNQQAGIIAAGGEPTWPSQNVTIA